jgi:hypothetical protein
MQPDPFPQIPEHDAPPEIAAIYAEIRAVSGVPVVNLIWRHFAALPGVLPWAWNAVAPLVASSAMEAARDRIAAAAVLPPLPTRDRSAWQAIGIDHRGINRLMALDRVYIRGNLTNLVSLTALRLRLENPDRPTPPLPSGKASKAPLEPPDSLPRIEDLSPRHAEQVRALARHHAGAGDGVIPSLYLALTRWPGLLDVLPSWLLALFDPATLHAARDGLCRVCEAEVQTLLPPGRAEPRVKAAIQPGLELFTRVIIPELTVVCLGLLQIAPPP